MKILVVNGYVRENKGDAALMSVLCGCLEEIFPSAEIFVASMEDPARYPTFEKWANVGSIRLYTSKENLSKLKRLTRKIIAIGVTLVWHRFIPSFLRKGLIRILPQGMQGEMNMLEGADLIVSMGGGYLNGTNSIGGNLNVFFLLSPLYLAVKLKKCVVGAPQSIGTFGNDFQNYIVKKVLSKMDLILVRELTTKSILNELGLKQNVVESVDSGFLFSPSLKVDIHKLLALKNDKRIVGFTVRKWLDVKKQASYESAMAAAADYFIKQYNVNVVFIPQVTSRYQKDDDRFTSLKVYERIKHKESAFVVEKDVNHLEVKAMYNNLDYIVGTRFHSVIFSLTSYVPAIAIEYEHKTGGIMKDLGLSQWVIRIDKVNKDNLRVKIDELVEQRQDYVKYLHKTLPSYIAKAKKANDFIKAAYVSSKK